ncbi:MAG: translocation/assembly module TamB domain-containing protein [Bacteroidota bacterium]
MAKARTFLKKTLKVIMWVVICYVLLFFIIAVLIQIPAIQNKLAHYATSFISNKTHTKVEIERIKISFPKSVVIEGLYLEDLNKDTLCYAGKVKVDLAFWQLFRSKILVNSLVLEDLNLNASRQENDSLFNYNFLLTAFSDTTKLKTVEPKTKSKWTFGVDYVKLKNINIHYYDDYGGIRMAAKLKQLNVKLDQIDLETLDFKVDVFILDGLSASVLMKESKVIKEVKTTSNLPKISASSISINNSVISYADSVNRQSIFAQIEALKLKDATVDLQKEIITLGRLDLSKSTVRYAVSGTDSTNIAKVEPKIASKKSDWNITVKGIFLEDNSIAYHVQNLPQTKNAFNASHLSFSHLTLSAENLYYSSAKTEVSIKKFEAVDQNMFSISKFEVDFSMNQHSITAKNLIANTISSSIDADLTITYSSLTALKDSIQNTGLTANLRKVNLKNSDITYFSQTLLKQTFFKNPSNITAVSGVIQGPINHLYGKNFAVKTGTNTILETDFTIIGLPNIKTATFDFPNLRIISGSQDLKIMAGNVIPKTIALPNEISIQMMFKGQFKSFKTILGMNTSFGEANLVATIDKKENFSAKLNITRFDLGSLMKNQKMYGPVSLTAETSGHGLDKKTITASVKADVSEIYLNQYTYHRLNVDGNIVGQQFAGKINLRDENAVFDFDGLVNITPNQERYKFRLDVQGADLKRLNVTKENIKIALVAESDLEGGSINNINGNFGITALTIVRDDKTYQLDSLLLASVNQPNKSELNIRSAIIGLKYSGEFSPASLPNELTQFVNNYFPFFDQPKKENELPNFNFEIQLQNHPILSEVFFPQLKEFEPGIIQGSYDRRKNDFRFIANIKKMIYGTTEIKDLVVTMNSDTNFLNYKISCAQISNAQVKLDQLLIDGKLANDKITANLSSRDENQNYKLLIRSEISKIKENFRITLNPKEFYLMNKRWEIAADNYIEFGKQGLLIHHLYLNNTQSQINITSVNDKFNDDLTIGIKNFKLDDISQIIEKDSSLVSGILDGNILLKRVNNSYGIIADAQINNLFVRKVSIGNLDVKADNLTGKRFDIAVKLTGAGNDLTAKGYYIPNGSDQSLDMTINIQSLSMKTAEAFSMGTITEASGNLTGNIFLKGKISTPDITGELVFNNVLLTPKALNNQLQLKNESIQFKKDGIYFNAFTILDINQHKAVINGTVKMEHFQNLFFDLTVRTNDFSLFNTTAKDNKEFFGKMIIDSKIDINGPMSLPVVNARLKLKKGSNFTFAVPEDKLTLDRGENIIEFNDTSQQNRILNRNEKKEKQKTGLTGYEISSIIEIDKQATLKLLMDPASSDSLVVKGDAALNFAIDRSGKMSLTGTYNLNEGSYLITLGAVIKRKFDIESGSTIIWNGNPLDADVSINAIYSVRAAPIDLVADQMNGLSEDAKSGYKQQYPFLVYLKLRGAILQPEISFEIRLSPEDKGILGGAVNAKLNLLNEDPSALNKQVFALLILGRFVQENPLQSENSGVSMAVRTSVSKFLSAQLNQWSSKVIPGVELNFDIQSYDDYQTGEAKGRTQVDIGLKKQLFNDRFSVQIGGTVDVEGDKAKQNSASEITSDVTVEYKLIEDGRLRLKGFRHNQYEGAIEGQLIETGIGILYVRDYDKWMEFFKSPKNKIDSTTKTRRNDSIKKK